MAASKFLKMEKKDFLYKGVLYSIESLQNTAYETLSERKKKALKSYERAQQSTTCRGFFGVSCNKTTYVSGYCSNCYHKQNYLKGVNSFISDVLCIGDMDVSTSNLLNFSQSKCVKCSKQTVTVSFPFCSQCLSETYGLAIRPSFIPGAGLGLFATRNFRKGECLKVQYTGKKLTEYEYQLLLDSCHANKRAKRKLEYVLEIPNRGFYIDGSDETGGPLRYINQAPSFELKNSKWQVVDGSVTVKTSQVVKVGCEFFLNYSQERSEYVPYTIPDFMTMDALEQIKNVCDYFMETKQTSTNSKRRKRE
jgi:hypothetical protein